MIVAEVPRVGQRVDMSNVITSISHEMPMLVGYRYPEKLATNDSSTFGGLEVGLANRVALVNHRCVHVHAPLRVVVAAGGDLLELAHASVV
eukprot:6631517-Pyramimonas_sp.AAC.1